MGFDRTTSIIQAPLPRLNHPTDNIPTAVPILSSQICTNPFLPKAHFLYAYTRKARFEADQ